MLDVIMGNFIKNCLGSSYRNSDGKANEVNASDDMNAMCLC